MQFIGKMMQCLSCGSTDEKEASLTVGAFDSPHESVKVDGASDLLKGRLVEQGSQKNSQRSTASTLAVCKTRSLWDIVLCKFSQDLTACCDKIFNRIKASKGSQDDLGCIIAEEIEASGLSRRLLKPEKQEKLLDDFDKALQDHIKYRNLWEFGFQCIKNSMQSRLYSKDEEDVVYNKFRLWNYQNVQPGIVGWISSLIRVVVLTRQTNIPEDIDSLSQCDFMTLHYEFKKLKALGAIDALDTPQTQDLYLILTNLAFRVDVENVYHIIKNNVRFVCQNRGENDVKIRFYDLKMLQEILCHGLDYDYPDMQDEKRQFLKHYVLLLCEELVKVKTSDLDVILKLISNKGLLTILAIIQDLNSSELRPDLREGLKKALDCVLTDRKETGLANMEDFVSSAYLLSQFPYIDLGKEKSVLCSLARRYFDITKMQQLCNDNSTNLGMPKNATQRFFSAKAKLAEALKRKLSRSNPKEFPYWLYKRTDLKSLKTFFGELGVVTSIPFDKLMDYQQRPKAWP